MIRDAASQIKEAFTALDEKNFFSYSFISESSHRYKKGLYEYCTTESSPMAILSSSYADSSFITLVEQNQLTKALIRVFSHHSSTAMARSFGKCNYGSLFLLFMNKYSKPKLLTSSLQL